MEKTTSSVFYIFLYPHRHTNVTCSSPFIAVPELLNNFYSQIVNQSVNAITLQFIG